ncbi:MAG: zinc-ribbon domain-containing protein [Clostridia bacterium]|nr:zinc-ribbon domain-containing protein [Clostridia bacterium]
MENATTGRKCPNCGEVVAQNAKFCENCGKALPALCPQCGQAHNIGAKFCPNCGYAFAPQAATKATPQATAQAAPAPQPVPAVKKEETPKAGPTFVEKVGKVFYKFPAILFFAFTALMFLFMLAPLALDPFFGLSLGNVYECLGDELLGLQGYAIVAFILAFLFLIFSFVYLFSVSKKGQFWRVRKDKFVSDILLWVSVGVYAFYFFLSIIYLIALGSEGYGGSTFSVLILIFSLLFAGGAVACFILSKKPFAKRVIVHKYEMKAPQAPKTPVLANINLDAEGGRQVRKYLKKTRVSAKWVGWAQSILAIFSLTCMGVLGGTLFAPIGHDGDSYSYSSGGDMENIIAMYCYMVCIFVLTVIGLIVTKMRFSESKSYPLYRAVRYRGNIAQIASLTMLMMCLTYAILHIVDFSAGYNELKGILDGTIIPEYTHLHYDDLDFYVSTHMAGPLSTGIIAGLSLIVTIIVFALRISRGKHLKHPSLKAQMDLFTIENMAEMEAYPKKLKEYKRAVKEYEYYLYDKENEEKHVSQAA